MSKVSIIIPVYNVEKYLSQCLDSVINQTYKDIEIICVDDGSTDNSLKILKEYAQKDSRICIICKQNEGLGAASARNMGLDMAKGKYVSILDSDDFFERDMIEKAVSRAENTDADIVVFDGYDFDHKIGKCIRTNKLLNQNVIPDKEVFSYLDCPDKIYQLSQGMAWNKLYRRDFLEKHNLRFQRIKYTDDAYFTFSGMVLAERIAVLKENLCYYRINTGTNQTGGLDAYPDSAYKPYLTLKESLIQWGIYDVVKQSFINCAVTFMRYFYDKITSYATLEYLHEKYRTEIFELLDISEQVSDYFYDERVFMWITQIKEHSAGDLIIKSAKSYGNENITGILRFLFPYERVPKGSRIVMIGDDFMGRYYGAQILLSGHCELVLSFFSGNQSNNYDILKNVVYDYVLVACVNSKFENQVVTMLEEMGISDEKIILGGTV